MEIESKPRLTVLSIVYYERPDLDPVEFRNGFSAQLEKDEEQRRKVISLEFGCIVDLKDLIIPHSLLILANTTALTTNVIPSNEEKEDFRKRALLVDDKFILTPGMNIYFKLQKERSLTVQSLFSTSKLMLIQIPE